MTHTKDTREAIARLIDEHVIAVSMSDSWLEGQEEAADAILAALEPAPQAGGDVRERVEAKAAQCEKRLSDEFDWLKHRHDYNELPHWSDGHVASSVRMLMRDQLNHEAICSAAANRIAKLSIELAALSATPAVGGWLPIETAPKDGTGFHAFWPDHSNGAGQWGAEQATTWVTPDGRFLSNSGVLDDFFPEDWKPTHWKPLDPPPLTWGEG